MGSISVCLNYLLGNPVVITTLLKLEVQSEWVGTSLFAPDSSTGQVVMI